MKRSYLDPTEYAPFRDPPLPELGSFPLTPELSSWICPLRAQLQDEKRADEPAGGLLVPFESMEFFPKARIVFLQGMALLQNAINDGVAFSGMRCYRLEHLNLSLCPPGQEGEALDNRRLSTCLAVMGAGHMAPGTLARFNTFLRARYESGRMTSVLLGPCQGSGEGKLKAEWAWSFGGVLPV